MKEVSKNSWINRQCRRWLGKVKESLLDILNNDTGKTGITPRESWITQAMNNKMEVRRKAKTTNIKKYRRLNNQLRRETERSK